MISMKKRDEEDGALLCWSLFPRLHLTAAVCSSQVDCHSLIWRKVQFSKRYVQKIPANVASSAALYNMYEVWQKRMAWQVPLLIVSSPECKSPLHASSDTCSFASVKPFDMINV